MKNVENVVEMSGGNRIGSHGQCVIISIEIFWKLSA